MKIFDELVKKCEASEEFSWGVTGVGIALMVVIAIL